MTKYADIKYSKSLGHLFTDVEIYYAKSDILFVLCKKIKDRFLQINNCGMEFYCNEFYPAISLTMALNKLPKLFRLEGLGELGYRCMCYIPLSEDEELPSGFGKTPVHAVCELLEELIVNNLLEKQ